MRLAPSIAGALILGCVTLFVAADAGFAQSLGAKAQPAPWTDGPVRVDPKAQTYQRLEASPGAAIEAANEAFPIRFDSNTYFKVIDSVSFNVGGKRYRLTGLEPVPPKKICRNGDGERWACGLRARAALGELLQVRMLRCVDRGTSAEISVVECRRNGKDIGGVMVLAGLAFATGGAERYQPEINEAMKAKAGIWADISPAK